MGTTTLSVIKTLIVPALISLLIFLITSYVLLPLWQRYHSRYSQYLPLSTLSDQTSSLRARMSRFLPVPGAIFWRGGGGGSRRPLATAASMSDDGADYDSEEGEELGEVDDEEIRRAIRRAEQGRRDAVDVAERRLSRDLEEGFRDDSDEEIGTSGRRR